VVKSPVPSISTPLFRQGEALSQSVVDEETENVNISEKRRGGKSMHIRFCQAAPFPTPSANTTRARCSHPRTTANVGLFPSAIARIIFACDARNFSLLSLRDCPGAPSQQARKMPHKQKRGNESSFAPASHAQRTRLFVESTLLAGTWSEISPHTSKTVTRQDPCGEDATNLVSFAPQPAWTCQR
jgi:hypothetical protein